MNLGFSNLLSEFAKLPASHTLDVVDNQLKIVEGPQKAPKAQVIKAILDQAKISGNLPDSKARERLYDMANRIVSDPSNLPPDAKEALAKIKDIAWQNCNDDSKNAKDSQDVKSSKEKTGIGISGTPASSAAGTAVVPLDADFPPMSPPKHVGNAAVQGPTAVTPQKSVAVPSATVTLKFDPTSIWKKPKEVKVTIEELKRLSTVVRNALEDAEQDVDQAIAGVVEGLNDKFVRSYTKEQFECLRTQRAGHWTDNPDQMAKVFELSYFLGTDVSQLSRNILASMPPMRLMGPQHIKIFCLAWQHLPDSVSDSREKEDAAFEISTYLAYQLKVASEVEIELGQLSKLKGFRLTVVLPSELGINFVKAIRKLGVIEIEILNKKEYWFPIKRFENLLGDLSHCHNISSMKVRLGQELSPKSYEIIGKMRQLKTLDIQGSSPTNDELFSLSKLASLEQFRFNGSLMTEEGIFHLTQFHYLEDLSISILPKLRAAWFYLAQLNSLKKFSLCYSVDIQLTEFEKGMSFLLKNLPLETLRLKKCGFQGKSGIEGRALKTLSLQDSIGDDCLAALDCPQLEYLWVINTIEDPKLTEDPNLTGQGLLRLVSNRNLKSLIFWDCSQLTGENLVAFYQKWAELHPDRKPPLLYLNGCPLCTIDHLNTIRSFFTKFDLDSNHFELKDKIVSRDRLNVTWK